jgi:imidazole glycerol phosphate synthase subunit HisF
MIATILALVAGIVHSGITVIAQIKQIITRAGLAVRETIVEAATT